MIIFYSYSFSKMENFWIFDVDFILLLSNFQKIYFQKNKNLFERIKFPFGYKLFKLCMKN